MGVQSPVLLLLLLLVVVVLGKPGELRGWWGVRGTRRSAEAHLLTSTQDRKKKAWRQVRSRARCEEHPHRPA